MDNKQFEDREVKIEKEEELLPSPEEVEKLMILKERESDGQIKVKTEEEEHDGIPFVHTGIIIKEEPSEEKCYEGLLDKPNSSRDDKMVRITADEDLDSKQGIPDMKYIYENPFKCYKCEYRTNRMYHLTKHLRTHTGEKPFKCKLCDYRCANKMYLVRHERAHMGIFIEKPYICDQCSYRCSQKLHLVNHQRTHTGEKPFNCNLCELKFSQKSHLVAHKRLHTGEKPFKCSLCKFETAHKKNLTVHMKNKHE